MPTASSRRHDMLYIDYAAALRDAAVLEARDTPLSRIRLATRCLAGRACAARDADGHASRDVADAHRSRAPLSNANARVPAAEMPRHRQPSHLSARSHADADDVRRRALGAIYSPADFRERRPPGALMLRYFYASPTMDDIPRQPGHAMPRRDTMSRPYF